MAERLNIYQQPRAKDIAEILVQLDLVQWSTDQPFKLSSGLQSPFYIDGRQVMSFPEERHEIWSELGRSVLATGHHFDAIAGVAIGGLPHATAVAYNLGLPLLIARTEQKQHGRGRQAEGRWEQSWNVALVEDTVTTGRSAIVAARALRNEGLLVSSVFSIADYGFPETQQSLKDAGLTLFSLTDFSTIVAVCVERKLINPDTLQRLWNWYLKTATSPSPNGILTP